MSGLLNNNFMGNPLFQMGVGILANNGHVGKGLQAGMLGMNAQQRMQMMKQQQAMQQKKTAMQMKQMSASQAAASQKQAAALKQQEAQQSLMGQMSPEIQQMAAAYPGIAKQMVKNKFMPPAPDMPSGMRMGENGEWAYDPAYLKGQMALKNAGAIRLNTEKQTLPTQDAIKREDMLSRATDARKFNASVLAQGHESQKSIGDYERAITLLEKAPTGPLEESIMEGKRLAGKMGIQVDWDKIGSAEELRVLLGNEVMARVAETKGAVSEREMDLFRQYSANYSNTPEGNRAILNFKKAKATRDAQLSKMVRRMQKKGATSLDVQEAVWAYIEQNDIASMLQAQSSPDIENLLQKYGQ